MTRELGEGELGELLSAVTSSGFYFEQQESYALGYEQPELEKFLAGCPTPPPQVDWWRQWLAQVAEQAGHGVLISRVRVIAEPPTDYQRWQLWSLPWHLRAGEQIGYLTRRQADWLHLPPGGDWWLLDGEQLITLDYDAGGRCASQALVTGPGAVEARIRWRDLAVRNATPAEDIAA